VRFAITIFTTKIRNFASIFGENEFLEDVSKQKVETIEHMALMKFSGSLSFQKSVTTVLLYFVVDIGDALHSNLSWCRSFYFVHLHLGYFHKTNFKLSI